MALPPFRADHVGSLLRPAALLTARDDHRCGRISAEELRTAEDEAIRQVVAMQAEAGLRSATDGEFRRTSWHMDFIYRLGGISSASDESIKVRFENPDGVIEFTTAALHVDGPVRLRETIFADDFSFLRGVAGWAVTPKLTIPSPSMVHYRGGPAALDPAVYPDEDQFWTDLSAAYADAGAGRVRAGLPLPAAGRHEPRVPQRPGTAGGADRARRRRRAPAPALHQADQRRDRRTGRRTCG